MQFGGASPEDQKSVQMRCKVCFDKSIPWEGCEVFANDEGCFIHCRKCNAFIANTQPMAMRVQCDLCKRGLEHEHPSFDPEGKVDSVKVPARGQDEN